MNDFVDNNAIPVEFGDKDAALIGENARLVDESGEPGWEMNTFHMTRFAIDDNLARDIRVRFGADEDAEVFIETETFYGGYSEYTQETDYSCIVECNGQSKSFSNYNAFNDLLDWLTETV